MTATAAPLPKTADVVVIGAGVIGLCAAHYLAEAGREVLVLDQGSDGEGASHGNAGLVAPSHSIPLPSPRVIRQGLGWMFQPSSPFYIRPRLDRELVSWLARFARASTRARARAGTAVLSELLSRSAELYRDLCGERDIGCDFWGDGVLNVYASSEGLEHGIAEVQRLEAYGLRGQVLSATELARLEPSLATEVAGGVLWPEDGWLDPSRFLSMLCGSLDRRGVPTHWQTQVLSIEIEGSTARRLQTTAGTVEVGELVLAAGAWSPALSRQLGIRLPLQAAKGYSITSKARGTLPRRPLLLAEAKVVATPMSGSLRLAGTLELVGIDLGVSTRRVEAVREAGVRFLPDLDFGVQPQVWCGLRPLCADGLPIIGRPGAFANVTLATGHGHLGLSLAPISGRLVAELLVGGPTSTDLRPLSPDRF